jgi:hypothetical protein
MYIYTSAHPDMASSMSPMIINFTQEQRAKIQRKAQATKQPMAEIVRTALDTYFAADQAQLSTEQMALLDTAMRRAEADLQAIDHMLDELQAGHQKFLHELAAIRRWAGKR